MHLVPFERKANQELRPWTHFLIQNLFTRLQLSLSDPSIDRVILLLFDFFSPRRLQNLPFHYPSLTDASSCWTATASEYQNRRSIWSPTLSPPPPSPPTRFSERPVSRSLVQCMGDSHSDRGHWSFRRIRSEQIRMRHQRETKTKGRSDFEPEFTSILSHKFMCSLPLRRSMGQSRVHDVYSLSKPG